MPFASFGLVFFFKALLDRSATKWTFLALFVWLAGLGTSHFGCSVVLASMGLIAGGQWLWASYFVLDPLAARKAFFTALTCLLAGLAVAPYWIRILREPNPHAASESPIDAVRILNDFFSKFFLGDHPLPSLLAWFFFWRVYAPSGAGRLIRPPREWRSC